MIPFLRDWFAWRIIDGFHAAHPCRKASFLQRLLLFLEPMNFSLFIRGKFGNHFAMDILENSRCFFPITPGAPS